jgi:hypothetical protein
MSNHGERLLASELCAKSQKLHRKALIRSRTSAANCCSPIAPATRE